MKLRGNKGHIAGKHVSGGHTTVIEGADTTLRKISAKDWFVSARPREVVVDRGGRVSLTIKRHSNETYRNTLTLTFRRSATVQKVDVVVAQLEANIALILRDIRSVAAKTLRGVDIYDRTHKK